MDQACDLLYKSNMPGTAKSVIQSYNLFGETGDLPDVIHCETIAARSVLHDWELEPHRHARLHQVLLVARGGGQLTIEGRRHRLRPMHLVNVPAGQVHGFSFRPGTQGFVVTFVAEMLDHILVPPEGLARVLAEAAVLRGTPEMRRVVTNIFAEYGARHYARAHILRALSATLLGLVAREIAAEHGPNARASGADLVQRFEALLDAHFIEHWPVARYAKALKVTPTHLTRVVRETHGCPATHMIRDRMVREARRHLVYTNLSISQIAYALRFDDPAYFSRTFTQATGQSPRDFRHRIGSL
ncbi:helix-turn-helix domain-containing protein [Pseudorhodoplanes sinuspersici]|uniref:AraC family transcriptional regulator n=1 Tax=Pseudorhodoplanes sinuspersici TaxID=1235591 RepID=A0A1W7A0S6_9HYPH|nr:helix-turn-helix domain-containing protein [Pseudorhodoplanes sinuspersici]ARQ03193.1 AraC family transcriptional regulator [Pseudorhodoplanes sinuspersici]